MGSVCSCLPLEDLDEHDGANTSRSPISCFGLRVSLPGVFHVYNSLFRRENAQPIPSSVESMSWSSTSSMDSSLAETYRSVPLPLPYDVDPRHCCMHQDNRVSPRHDKGTSNSRDESEPLRISDSLRDSEPVTKGDKSSKSTCEEAVKQNCKSSKKLPSVKSVMANEYFYTSTEDEDVCPTCLEEYSEENPKIVTKCSHHYHLGCIYEWMERSDRCPVCGKVMAFDEFT